MTPCPKYPRPERDTTRLIQALFLAALAYAALTFGIHILG